MTSFLRLICAILFISFFAGVSFAQPKAKTFIYCSEGSPSNLNPQIAFDGVAFAVSKHYYNRLIDFKYGETIVTPALAESWKVSKDQLKYTFKLRKNVKFHSNEFFKPTRDMNADDVLFSFHRQLKKDHPYHKVGGGSYEYFVSMEMDKLLKDVKKIDDYTVEFELTRAEASFIANLGMDFTSILSAEYAQKMMEAKKPQTVDLNPIGTGAFVFKGYVKDSVVRLESFPEYYEGKAKIDKLVFAITPDPSVRYQKLKTGECHLIAYPSATDLAEMKKNPELKVMEKPGLNVGYLAMNTQKKPFDNIKVRQAVNHALNKKAYLDAIYLGQAILAKNIMPPILWGYNDQVKDYDYNVNKAKKLLAEAGFPNGFETELWTLPVSRPYILNGKKLGEMMQADLAQVGIKAKLTSYDWPTYLAKSKIGEHQMMQFGWTGDNGDPDNFLSVLLSCAAVEGGSNRSRWCFKEYDDLVTKAKLTSNQKERTMLYRKAQEVSKREAPQVPIAHAKTFRAMRKNVEGYKVDPLGSEYFYPVDLK